MTTIKQNVKNLLDANMKAKARLAYEFARHTYTIDRWIEENNPILTTPQAVRAISEELLIPESEILAA